MSSSTSQQHGQDRWLQTKSEVASQDLLINWASSTEQHRLQLPARCSACPPPLSRQPLALLHRDQAKPSGAQAAFVHAATS